MGYWTAKVGLRTQPVFVMLYLWENAKISCSNNQVKSQLREPNSVMQGLYEPSSLRNAEHREDPGKQNANEKEVVYSENFTLFSDGMKSPIPQILSLKNLTPVSPGLTGLQQPMPTSLTPGLHVTQENHGDSDKRFLQSGTL